MGISKGKWQEQLKAAEASGMSLVGYAAQQGINVRCPYDTRRARTQARAQPGKRASAFVPVKLKPAPSATQAVQTHQAGALARLGMQARLGNGVVQNWTHDASNDPVGRRSDRAFPNCHRAKLRCPRSVWLDRPTCREIDPSSGRRSVPSDASSPTTRSRRQTHFCHCLCCR